jgi:hypothetical protein
MWKDLFTSDKARELLESAAKGGPGLVGNINTLAVVRGTCCVYGAFLYQCMQQAKVVTTTAASATL